MRLTFMDKKMNAKKIRYGVVGLGSIAQLAVLPAFKNASMNSDLTTLISEDKQKLKVLAKKYKVENTYLYDDMELCFQKKEIDALYIATPNDHHREIVELAAKYKINILCEKPMAVTHSDCLYMDQAAKKNGIKLMVAYRLHFEAANLEAVKMDQLEMDVHMVWMRVFTNIKEDPQITESTISKSHFSFSGFIFVF